MKKPVSKRIASALVAGMLMVSPIISSISASAGDTFTTTSTYPNNQKTGWYNNYHHEIWQADTPNSSSMTLHDNDGGFSTQWKCGPNGSRGNFLARRGLFWDKDNPKTYKDYKPFVCDYDCTWSAGSSGNSRICIYGWAQNPLVEYYIIEDWKNWSPAQDASAQYKGSCNIDGSQYKVYTCQRKSYTIEGDNLPFTQYISIRQNLRTKGTIHVSEHFKAWESMGMKMNNLYEIAFNVEGWESDGSADVKMDMYEDDGGYNPDPVQEESEIEGTLYSATFENGTNYWTGRGSASVTSSSSTAYEGSKSLYVSGRTDNWNGGEVELNTSTFKPGSAYSFSTMVNPTESTTLQLTMQYDDQSGTTNYTQIAEGSCTAGKWTKLENTNFTIPSGASNVKMYVEAPDSLCNFYVDRAIIANKGYTASGSSSSGTSSTSATVPSNIKVAYSSQYKQLQFTWDKVKGADKYGIAVYLAGKWRVQTSNISGNSYVTPKNLTPNMSYKVAIAARVNGKWDTAGALENYVTVTTRANNNIEYHTPSNSGNTGGNNENNGGNNNQQQTTSNYNYQSNMQFKEAPSYYFNSCSQQGKVVKESYNGINGYNSLNVYLPYGYDSSKKYNIFYLMHGGGENENTLFYQDDTMMQNLFDNMIKNGELDPLIVVTPTFNKTEAGKFYNEFRQSVVPFVEGKYSTYAGKNTSQSSLQASRMHRAYGGFSMGGVSTWAVMENCLDIVGYFMPLSGDHWNGNSGYDKAKSIANAIDKSGLQKNQYFIFAATGSDDIAYPNVNPQINEMKKMSQFVYTSDFSKGNLYFLVASGKTHWWGYVRHYVYDALPSFFHEGQ